MIICSTYVGEVVLGQHGVGGVRRVVIREHNVLSSLAAVYDLIGASLHLRAELLHNGNNGGSNNAKDPDGQLLLQLLDNLGQNRDPLNGRRDSLEDAVVELDSRHDGLEHLSNVDSKGLGVTRRDRSGLHLSGRSVGLDLIDFVALMLSAENTVGNLIKKLTKDTGVLVLGLLKSSLQLLELVLGQFVGDCVLRIRQYKRLKS